MPYVKRVSTKLRMWIIAINPNLFADFYATDAIEELGIFEKIESFSFRQQNI